MAPYVEGLVMGYEKGFGGQQGRLEIYSVAPFNVKIFNNKLMSLRDFAYKGFSISHYFDTICKFLGVIIGLNLSSFLS